MGGLYWGQNADENVPRRGFGGAPALRFSAAQQAALARENG